VCANGKTGCKTGKGRQYGVDGHTKSDIGKGIWRMDGEANAC